MLITALTWGTTIFPNLSFMVLCNLFVACVSFMTRVHLSCLQLNSFGVKERLSRLLSSEPSEMLLDLSEALRITTEAYRLWAVAAGYGQACKLYMWVNTFKVPTSGKKIPE